MPIWKKKNYITLKINTKLNKISHIGIEAKCCSYTVKCREPT